MWKKRAGGILSTASGTGSQRRPIRFGKRRGTLRLCCKIVHEAYILFDCQGTKDQVKGIRHCPTEGTRGAMSAGGRQSKSLRRYQSWRDIGMLFEYSKSRYDVVYIAISKLGMRDWIVKAHSSNTRLETPRHAMSW